MQINYSYKSARLDDESYFIKCASLLLLSVLLVYSEAIYGLIIQWWTSEEYGHGLFMPFVAAYIVWQKRDQISEQPLSSNLTGIPILAFSLFLLVGSTLADIASVKSYAFCIALIGVSLLLGGLRLLRFTILPIILLGLVVPLPYLLISSLTSGLQLISSELGTWFIRSFGIPVFLEGNIIDMGTYKLQVVEACSGLRYLYPLLSIALIVSYFMRTGLIFKVLLIASVVPVTIFMNSLRIAVTGVLVNAYGNEVADGFLHDFEGWVVFMAALALLLFEVYIYKVFFRRKERFAELFDLLSTSASTNKLTSNISSYRILVSESLILLTAVLLVYIYMADSQIPPERELFNQFPMRIDGKNVELTLLEPDVLDILRPDDYFLGTYGRSRADQVSLYMVYYSQQHDGSALHSPRVCIPGGGWIIEDEQIISFNLQKKFDYLEVNRAVIRRGELTQIVYYWIDQRGVQFTNEYLARASLLKSSVMEGRTDGALIRVNVLVENDDFNRADKELQDFVRDMSVFLPDYIPS
ncbi:VPLPA-CTERM-specific exosortase XrtD [Marinobacterium mangrovicola]|uniref:Exosortase D (VPLPA-CTERM-specific) n=1 Tax=Marinobacterium mangrovicola TaxID=1476959 RepID=A0A4R1GKR4_9GAMM|nr:VPLPA-CTERM-specific exosortase XrtD [Marinobacterium mangrovicola]TCK07545.1 exosortase D (VPLPA-CTERM-specific) [Marinobacterium mangrovicola]